MNLSLAFRLALREMRGGLKGFRVFLACLALGVAAVAAVWLYRHDNERKHKSPTSTSSSATANIDAKNVENNNLTIKSNDDDIISREIDIEIVDPDPIKLDYKNVEYFQMTAEEYCEMRELKS